MAAQEWMEIPVFIHGITPNKTPGSHREQYERLRDLINAALVRAGKAPFTEESIGVEWGWGLDHFRADAPYPDEYLAAAQRSIAAQAEQVTDAISDWTLNPMRALNGTIRQVMFLGFGDIFYYVSMDGEKSIRQHIFTDLSNKIIAREAELAQKISLTLIAHSAGSVIAHDLLYHLFREAADEHVEAVNDLRKLIEADRLRVRRFYTMGSPITPLIFRSNSLLLKTMKQEMLDPEDIGLRKEDQLSQPRWVNFWDKDDILSYPLSFLYQTTDQAEVVEDKYLDLGDWFPAVHMKYWESDQLAAYIAETF